MLYFLLGFRYFGSKVIFLLQTIIGVLTPILSVLFGLALRNVDRKTRQDIMKASNKIQSRMHFLSKKSNKEGERTNVESDADDDDEEEAEQDSAV